MLKTDLYNAIKSEDLEALDSGTSQLGSQRITRISDTIGRTECFKLFAETAFRVDGLCEASEFQIEGPATENALLANFVLVLSTTKWPRDTERKRSLLQLQLCYTTAKKIDTVP